MGLWPEDLGVGTAQVVAVEQSQIGKLTGAYERRGKAEEIGSSGRGNANQFRCGPVLLQKNGGSVVTKSDAGRT
ncbi:MAG TPA: hypothetical protein VN151_15250, partial [Terracidiphilus sp.]|nr:hypothetical protein [Terracidiphilus sp.]